MRLTTIVASLIIAGCAGTQFSWESARMVKVGMTEKEVEAIMGPPYLIKSTPEGTTWIWSHASVTSNVRTYSINLKGGKVTATPDLPDTYR